MVFGMNRFKTTFQEEIAAKAFSENPSGYSISSKS
jgi:hypothetical protein